LSPIKDLKISEVTANWSALGATVTLHNGEEYEVDFKDIDGKRAC
jgi:hypothetical protein